MKICLWEEFVKSILSFKNFSLVAQYAVLYILSGTYTHFSACLGGSPTDNSIEQPVSYSVLTERAMETIRLLRRELERCHADLQTDEELFAEKMEEMSQLQAAYNQLLREKERLEDMWMAAQENEGANGK